MSLKLLLYILYIELKTQRYIDFFPRYIIRQKSFSLKENILKYNSQLDNNFPRYADFWSTLLYNMPLNSIILLIHVLVILLLCIPNVLKDCMHIIPQKRMSHHLSQKLNKINEQKYIILNTIVLLYMKTLICLLCFLSQDYSFYVGLMQVLCLHMYSIISYKCQIFKALQLVDKAGIVVLLQIDFYLGVI